MQTNMLSCCKKISFPCHLVSTCRQSLLHHNISQRTTKFFQATSTLQRNYSTENDMNSYDVIVCGGGMVGTVMACALGNSPYMEGKKMLLVDSGKPIDTDILDQPGPYSNRVCAISPGSIKFLKNIGVWQHIPRSQAVERMQVWDACSDARISFDSETGDISNNYQQQKEQHGICSITENNLIVSAAMRQLMTTKVDTKFGVNIVDCEIPSENGDHTKSQAPSKITLNDGSVLSAKLIIGADGVNSFLAKQMKLPKIGWNYDSFGVVATLKLSEPCVNNTAWQRFLPSGPIALLPLSNELTSLVWSTTPDHAKMLCECNSEDLAMQVNDAFWENHSQNEIVSSTHDKLKEFLSWCGRDRISVQQYPPSVEAVIGRAQRFPLGLSHTEWYIKSRIAFIGDTIHRVHPLAGQGANMGYRDVKNLMNVIEESVYDGRDFGHLSSLKDYESRGQLENLPFLFVSDAMKRLYSTDFWPVVMLRSSGLEMTNAIPPIKEFLMKKAMS